MATLAQPRVPARSEERFFFIMACVIAAMMAGAFSLHLALGRSTFAVPPIYHVHAFVFFGWLALFVAQSGLASSGNAALHRRLGLVSLLWIPLMLVVGTLMTVTSLRRTGGPFFFDANEFLLGNPIGLVAFAGLAGAALALRRRTDWHRRLMLGSLISIAGPGFGRLLPMPLMIPWAWEISNLACTVFVFVAMRRDARHRGQVHPAWYVVLAAMVGFLALGELLAYTPWGIDLTRWALEGSPGAARPMQAYLP